MNQKCVRWIHTFGNDPVAMINLIIDRAKGAMMRKVLAALAVGIVTGATLLGGTSATAVATQANEPNQSGVVLLNEPNQGVVQPNEPNQGVAHQLNEPNQ